MAPAFSPWHIPHLFVSTTFILGGALQQIPPLFVIMYGVFNALGEVLMQQGERQTAITAFEKAVKLAPNDATFRQNLESAKAK